MNIEKLQKAIADAGLPGLLLMDDKNIFYATGFRPTDSAALITPDSALLVTDSRYIEAARNECVPGVTVELTTRARNLTTCLAAAAEAKGLRTVGFEEEYVSFGLHGRLEKALGLALMPAQEVIRALRAIKSEEELASMTAAQRIAEKALDEVLGLIKPGMSERELAAELTYRMLLHGGEGNSFDPIAITGTKTSMPHGVPGDRLIAEGDFVTMDFGCLKGGYCSDMTRTVAVGSATDEMKNVYYTVLRAQLAGIEKAKPGATGAEVHNAAAAVIEEAGYGEYFGHGFGHSVGLDIHESPNASPANTHPLPEGAVITAEPGIYLPGKFGVRIEDMLYLKGTTNINLTQAPKTELIVLGA